MLRLAAPDLLIALAEDYAALLAETADHERATRLFGSADAMRERLGVLRESIQQVEIEEPLAKTRAALPPSAWDHEYQLGHSMTIEAALTEAYAANAPA